MPSGGRASRGGGLSIAVTAIVLLARNALDRHQLERAVIADADWPAPTGSMKSSTTASASWRGATLRACA